MNENCIILNMPWLTHVHSCTITGARDNNYQTSTKQRPELLTSFIKFCCDIMHFITIDISRQLALFSRLNNHNGSTCYCNEQVLALCCALNTSSVDREGVEDIDLTATTTNTNTELLIQTHTCYND